MNGGSDRGDVVEDAQRELHLARATLRAKLDQIDQARRSVDEERRRASELFSQLPGGYVQTDAYGKILDANAATAELLNATPKHLRGKRLVNYVVSAEGRRDFHLSLVQLRRGGVLHERAMILRPRKGAPLVRVTLSATAKTDGAGGVVTAHWLLRKDELPLPSDVPTAADDPQS